MMKNNVLLLMAASLAQTCLAPFSCSNKTSVIKVSPNATFTIQAPISGYSGTIAIENGGTVTGSTIQFADGILVDSQSQSGAVEGTFERDFTTLPTVVDNIALDGGKAIFINGEVRGTVTIEGLNNSISGTPRFTNPITLSSTVITSLKVGITTDCDADILLNGNTLTLDHDLAMAPGTKISSSGFATGIINLNNNALSIGKVTGGWTDEFTFNGSGSINLYSTVNVSNIWHLTDDITITGNGNTLDITNSGAQIIIGANTTLRLNDVTLRGLANSKVVFTDATSKLELVNANIQLQGNFLQTTGELVTTAESKLFMTSQSYFWKFQAPAIFTNQGTTLWVDTGLNDGNATFGLQNGTVFTSFVDFETVKQVVDFEQVRDASIRYILSEDVREDTAIEASFFVQPNENIIFTGSTTVTADGININFSNTQEAQFVIEPKTEVTFQGNQTLSIYSNTIDIAPGAALVIGNQQTNTPSVTQLVINDDFNLNSGTIKLSPGSTLKLSGAGSGQRVDLGGPLGSQAKIDIGYGELELSNTDFSGLEQIEAKSSYVGNTLREGRIAMTGNTRIHVNKSTSMNFFVRGSGNVLVMTANELELTGKISFDPESDNTLEIRFELDEVVDILKVSFGKDTMYLNSDHGTARLTFVDDNVQITNKDPDSFVIKGRAFLSGQSITIATNPIKQYTSDLTLGQNLSLVAEAALISPTVLTKSLGHEFFARRGFSSLNDSNLPDFEHFFVNRTLTKAPKRPDLRIPGELVSRSTKGTIRLQRYGQLNSFGVDEIEPLELQLTGNTRVKPPIRRIKRTVNAVRAINIPNFNDAEYTDRLKSSDVIYVSGQDNRIFVTGNFEIKGEIVFDEKAELIFEFDDSIDTPKAIKFATITSGGDKGLVLPKSASLIFQGAGQVVFEDGATIEFNGDAPALVGTVSGNLSSFDDNRPSIILKNYAELAVDQGEELLFQGNGQVLLQNNATARISKGQLLIGSDPADNFDLSVDRQSSIKVGNFDTNAVVAANAAQALFSLGEGNFGLKFNRQSQLQVRSAGIFEIALDHGTYLDGHMEEFSFFDKSVLDITSGGRLALGQSTLDAVGNSNSMFNWDSREAIVTSGGILSLYKDGNANPFVEGMIQNNKFNLIDNSAFGLFKTLTRFNSAAKLVNATDFYDASGQYKVLFYNNTVATLKAGDVVRTEGIEDKLVTFDGTPIHTLGAVFGTTASGLDFVVSPQDNLLRKEYPKTSP